MKDMKAIFDSENRNELLRDRFLVVYYRDPRPVSWYAEQIGVNASVINALIQGRDRKYRPSIFVKVLKWLEELPPVSE